MEHFLLKVAGKNRSPSDIGAFAYGARFPLCGPTYRQGDSTERKNVKESEKNDIRDIPVTGVF